MSSLPNTTGSRQLSKFSRWMERVDTALVKRCGLESADLIDACYADFYESGLTPSQAARQALSDQF